MVIASFWGLDDQPCHAARRQRLHHRSEAFGSDLGSRPCAVVDQRRYLPPREKGIDDLPPFMNEVPSSLARQAGRTIAPGGAALRQVPFETTTTHTW
jgi:hypothetical protein